MVKYEIVDKNKEEVTTLLRSKVDYLNRLIRKLTKSRDETVEMLNDLPKEFVLVKKVYEDMPW